MSERVGPGAFGPSTGGGTGTGTVTEVTSTTDTLTVDTATTTPQLTVEGAPAIAGTTVTGTATDGKVLTGTGDATASWETAGGGSGTVTEVSGTDTGHVTVADGTTTPVLTIVSAPTAATATDATHATTATAATHATTATTATTATSATTTGQLHTTIITGNASDGKVLTGTAANAADWQASSSSGSALWISGYWYGCRQSVSGVSIPLSNGYWIPFVVQKTFHATALGIFVKTALASSTVRLALSDTNGSGKPGSLVTTGGTVATITTGLKQVAITEILTPGVYWLAAAHQGITGTLSVASLYAPWAEGTMWGLFTAGDTSQATSFCGWKKTGGITGAFPTPAPEALIALIVPSNTPAIFIKSA